MQCSLFPIIKVVNTLNSTFCLNTKTIRNVSPLWNKCSVSHTLLLLHSGSKFNPCTCHSLCHLAWGWSNCIYEASFSSTGGSLKNKSTNFFLIPPSPNTVCAYLTQKQTKLWELNTEDADKINNERLNPETIQTVSQSLCFTSRFVSRILKSFAEI